MTLVEYLERNDLTIAAFARQAGLKSRQLVHRYVRCDRFPPPEALKKIRDATGGAVTADDFVNQHLARQVAA
ncbi:helix-turn-helix transcriptional regulator [Roseomonas sp. NAR14]|uniref:Helix-turn-helix transcriptional regulator n=1 Tax=Roseomonas acroporae TaxID=2937791 RepID=A0A9X2BWU5_9PROT|nr:helix-turn-helix transcriptional regulator [Roseomonas acroporae]MCK8788173.1 helix-turn-helix transcriptional regulator [Roseomonas acroporae]